MSSQWKSQTVSDCGYRFASILRRIWFNYTATAFNGSTVDMDAYSCQYAAYNHLTKISQPVERQLSIVCSLFGLLGALLTILTLSQKRFRILDFQLYRLIGYLEICQMADVAIFDLLSLTECDTNYTCTFLWAHVGSVVMNVNADAIDLLVLFLCIERTVACLLPQHFYRIHTSKCYTTFAVFSLIASVFFNIFNAFELDIIFEEKSNRYRDEFSDFSYSNFYIIITQINTARFYAMAVLIMIATGFSIWGFCTVARRRKQLGKNYGPQSDSPLLRRKLSTTLLNLMPNSSRLTIRNTSMNSHGGGNGTRKVKKRETELSCLQLCLAAPIIVNHVLYATGLSMNQTFVIGESAFEKGLNFNQATGELNRALSFHWLRMATNLTNVLAHALHFYLYILFSLQVRHAFVLLLTTCREKLLPRKYDSSQSPVVIDNRFVTGVVLKNEVSAF